MEYHKARTKLTILLITFSLSLILCIFYLFIGKTTVLSNWKAISNIFLSDQNSLTSDNSNRILSSLNWLGVSLENVNQNRVEIKNISYSYAIGIFIFSFILFYSFLLTMYKRYTKRQYARIEGLKRIVSLFELRDSHSADHSSNVAIIAKNLGESYKLGAKKVNNLYLAGLVHDIGKISVPVDILNKEGTLRPDEWKVIREHALVSQEILSYFSELKDVQRLVGFHHEKVDGSGYPNGLVKKNIPLGGRILAVADIMEALTGERPYRKPMHYSESFELMRSMNLDIEILDRLIEIWPSVKKQLILQDSFSDELELKKLEEKRIDA